MFSVGASALKLALSGYYQPAYQLLRDMLETVNLVDLFRADHSKISEWRGADDKKLAKDFGPAAVRKALSAFPQFVGQDRQKKYALISRHASHATYKGFQLIAPENQPRMGPFLHGKFLKAFLEDQGMHLSHVALALGTLFERDISPLVLSAKGDYLARLGQYHRKYLGR